MKEESLLLLSDLQKLINQVVLIDYTIIILGGEAYGQRKYGIVGSAWVLHTFDMDSLVGIVNSFLSNFGVCCV